MATKIYAFSKKNTFLVIVTQLIMLALFFGITSYNHRKEQDKYEKDKTLMLTRPVKYGVANIVSTEVINHASGFEINYRYTIENRKLRGIMLLDDDKNYLYPDQYVRPTDQQTFLVQKGKCAMVYLIENPQVTVLLPDFPVDSVALLSEVSQEHRERF